MSGGGAVKRKRPTKRQTEYMAKLRDPRWQKHKNEVLERDEYTCTWCGAGLNDGRNLQVHHGFYAKKYDNPWEYPKLSLFTLCEKCHEKAEKLRRDVYEQLGHLHPKFFHHIFHDLEEANEKLSNGGVFEELEVPWTVNRSKRR